MAGQGFYTGALPLPDLINKICNELKTVSGSCWSEPDLSGDWINDAAAAGHRALKYVNGSETIYITFELLSGGRTRAWGNTLDDGVELYYISPNTVSGKGLRFGFAYAWDDVLHAPTGSWMQTFIAYYSRFSSSPASLEDWRCTGKLLTAPIDYWVWIENNGFALMGIPEHQSQNDESGAFMLVCERNPDKEYNDGMPFFYGYARQSNLECNGSRSNANYDGYRHECVLRPWTYRASTQKEFYADPNTDYKCDYQMLHSTWDTTDLGHPDDPIGIEFPKPAIKSSGSGKVYYVKPIVHNSFSVGANKHETAFDPIFQSEFFLAWRPDTGIVQGDILKWESPSTRQYLVLEIGSQHSTGKLRYAIKYHD